MSTGPSDPRTDKPAAGKPLVLIPVTAGDVARQKRRKVMIWALAGLIVLLAAFLGYRRISIPREARQAYDSGVRLFSATRYEQAALNFSRAIDLMPDFADAYRMRARVYVAQSTPDFAARDFTKVLALTPNNAGVLVERGSAYLDLKDYPKAIADAGLAISLDPKLGRAYTLRATARRATGDAAGAIQDFTAALGINPNLENYFQRAATYHRMGKYDLAVADFTSAISFDSTQPHIFFARAQSKAAGGDAKGAKEDIVVGRKLDGE